MLPERHASLLSSFLLENSLSFGVNGNFICFQKLVGNLDEMTVANSGRQHERSLDSNQELLRIYV
jgi:hypothetical protein